MTYRRGSASTDSYTVSRTDHGRCLFDPLFANARMRLIIADNAPHGVPLVICGRLSPWKQVIAVSLDLL